jgi:hypothetical protein
VFVAPWTVHGTLNLSSAPARFQVIGQPAAMSGYFVEPGMRVGDERATPDREPPGPADLREIAKRWEIPFWTGPVDTTPVR